MICGPRNVPANSEPLDSAPVWDIVAEYRKDQDVVRIEHVNEPAIKMTS